MSRKFSLAYLTIPGVDPVEHIRIARQTGYDAVGLRTIPLYLPGEPEFLVHRDKQLFDAVKHALAEYDMKVLDIELARIRPDLNIDDYDAAFEAAAALGATDVLGSVWTRDRSFYTDQVGKVAEMAARYDCTTMWSSCRGQVSAICRRRLRWWMRCSATISISWWTPSMPVGQV